jgi:hypothetical protein
MHVACHPVFSVPRNNIEGEARPRSAQWLGAWRGCCDEFGFVLCRAMPAVLGPVNAKPTPYRIAFIGRRTNVESCRGGDGTDNRYSLCEAVHNGQLRPVALGFVCHSDSLPEGPARGATYERRNDLVVAYAPWILATCSYQNRLVRPWARGLVLHPCLRAPWMYYKTRR